ncbi:tudor domain-containing 6 isoform X1 [Poecilia latipinna]|uniref:tudor domain-containing 6 isoform X1 n=1 Tax=Poecilia latipinna TaxID=48699 RepID=UPI00072E75C5|nr:PREDICTED: tudor domain-containing protein 6-like isoform X1 [Poecilia latipinna]XP_014888014.1 PREDICTED: tudor domain-containing protein 6-like isoform X1 [Poecilia latipinna]
MSAIPGLPARGSDVTVLVTRVHLHPLCELVAFWGKLSQQRSTDYEILADEIQSHGALFKDLEGNPGDQCLVHIDTTWYRARIVSRNGTKCSVFLIDRGMTYTGTTSKLAWGKKEHFLLPPEVELCVLANVLPLSSENRWSPVALEFLKSFTGKLMDAHVQDVLVPDRMILLNIPCISKQMYEMGFAKKLSPATFQDFLHTSLKSISGAEALTEVQQLYLGSGERLQKQELFMYPELPGGTVETVIVTEVTNPQQIFCQLKVFSHELKKLTEKVTQSCEGKVSSCMISPDMIGYPCAARGRDGRWYRSVIQQVFPTNKVVEVLNVDYGTKQFVQVENVKRLAAEFTRMPVVTYVCSLHGILDKKVGWTTSEIDFLKSLLLHKTVIAKVEYRSISDQVYYVTLYGDDNINMNSLFGSKENCFPKYEKTLGDYALPSGVYTQQHPAQPERKVLSSQPSVEDIPAEDLVTNSSHLAVVHHVSSPSEFWIQTENYRKELEEMLDAMYHLYQDSANTHMLINPSLGLYCAAQAQDGEFYRATVTEVGETQIKVFFVDYGNTEVIDGSKIRTLPAEFRKMPQLGLKCSLAGVRPKDGRWSQNALEYFIKTVTDKELLVHVKGRYSDSYVVQLTNPEAQTEQDVNTQMCTKGFGERTEIPREPTVKGAMKPSVVSSGPFTDGALPQVCKDIGISFRPAFGLLSNERKISTFKEQMFPIGSVLDVNVSCIESPNDFWCQLVQNAGSLRLLMHDIQAYYANSEFEPNVDAACVARHPENGMWYRALVIRKHETSQVDVLFVDYGQTKTVSLFDLRKISPEFLALHGQAFRCSLLNLISSTSAINEWNYKAKERFQNFVENAASNFIILKCTIYAVMHSEQMVLHNIVDLETPFESICNTLASLITSIPPKKTSGPSFRLDTYYYSTHNIKTGTEEQVTVAFVNSVSDFYCHLDKNADVMKDLTMRVNTLCQQLERVKVPAVFGTLCFARYTDGQWYRAQIKATRPKLLVHFVDYGETLQVDKSDLLPVPKEANDIMSVPVQAVVCALSDVPTDVPSEVNEWFEKTATECQFRALIVAREADGKLLVELYHGNTQINAKIKKTFQIEKQEEQVVCQSWKPHQVPATHAPKTERTFSNRAMDSKDYEQPSKKSNFSTTKAPCQTKLDGKSMDENLRSAVKSTTQKHRPAPRELYKPPSQRQPNRTLTNDGSEEASGQLRPRKVSPPPKTERFISESSGTESQEETPAEKLPKLIDLPSKCITPGTAVDVYVSHCDSPLSLFVQHVSEEDDLFSLVEKLNNPDSTSKASPIKDVHPGDLVKAEFTDDSSWYRAVVKETLENARALVEFIDFGNTAVMPISKMEQLPKSLLLFPVYSTHCMLKDAVVLGEEKAFEPHVVSAFKEDIGSCGDKVLKCQFIKQVGSMWEVTLEDGGLDIGCKVSTDGSDFNPEKLVNEQQVQHFDKRKVEEDSEKPLPPCSLGYPHQKEIQEGQQLEVYIATINEDQTFWCQSADSQELCMITSAVSEVENAADQNINPDALYLGMPCVALFADDQLWYRAEVVDKNDNELSVLFVDYGNNSQANITDIRVVPPALLEVPPQAFLCELEGFDASHGSWRDGAADELSSLTADKLLQLTVTRVTRTEGKVKYVVELECEGQVINEAMNASWSYFETEDMPDSGGSATPQKLDSINTLQDLHDASYSACTVSQDEEHIAEELNFLPIENGVLKLASSPKQSECSKDSNNETVVEFGQDEQESSEGIIMVPAAMTPPEDIFPSDGVVKEPLQLSADLLDEKDISCLSENMIVVTGQDPEEENTSMLHAGEPNDDGSSPRDGASGATDELEIGTGDKETLSTYFLTLEMDTVNAPATVAEERNVAALQADLMTFTSEETMDLQDDVLKETTDTELDSSKQTEPAPSSTTIQEQLCEQETKTGEGILHEEETCVSTDVQPLKMFQNDSASEEAASTEHVDAQPVLLQQFTTTTSKEQSYTFPPTETGEDAHDFACSLEETHPADSEQTSDEKISAADCQSHVIAEEMTLSISVAEGDVDHVCDRTEPAEESDEVHEVSAESVSGIMVAVADFPQHVEVPCTPGPDKDNSPPEDETVPVNADGELQTYRDVRNMDEELTCSVSESCLADVSQDSEQDPDTETDCKSEETAPLLSEEFDDSELTEESLSAEDSFEAQLSKITHLCLIVKDGAADYLPEQQPEE